MERKAEEKQDSIDGQRNNNSAGRISNVRDAKKGLRGLFGGGEKIFPDAAAAFARRHVTFQALWRMKSETRRRGRSCQLGQEASTSSDVRTSQNHNSTCIQAAIEGMHVGAPYAAG